MNTLDNSLNPSLGEAITEQAKIVTGFRTDVYERLLVLCDESLRDEVMAYDFVKFIADPQRFLTPMNITINQIPAFKAEVERALGALANYSVDIELDPSAFTALAEDEVAAASLISDSNTRLQDIFKTACALTAFEQRWGHEV